MKTIYTSLKTEDEFNLYCYDPAGTRQKLGEIGQGSTVKFNASHPQIVFEREGKTYLSTEGQEAHQVSSDQLVLSADSIACNGANCITYPVQDLYNRIYRNQDDEVRQIGEKNVKLVSKAYNVWLDASGEYLYYMYDLDELRMVKVSYDKLVEMKDQASKKQEATED